MKIVESKMEKSPGISKGYSGGFDYKNVVLQRAT